MICRIALNSGSIICSCVLTQKGTVLKVTVVDFLNFLNRKSYRHSLVFFVSDHIFPPVLHQTSQRTAKCITTNISVNTVDTWHDGV